MEDQILQTVLVFDGATLRETTTTDAFVTRGETRPSYVTSAQFADYLTAYRRAVFNIQDRQRPIRYPPSTR